MTKKKYDRPSANAVEQQTRRLRTVPPQDWYEQLTKGLDGKPDGRSVENVMLALQCAPAWRDLLTFDKFSLIVELHQPMPQSGKLPIKVDDQGFPKPMTDKDVTLALTWFHELGMLKVSKTTVYDCLVVHAHLHSHHPVLDWFAEICAGPEPAVVRSEINDHLIDRTLPEPDALSMLFTLGFGADDTPLHRAVSRSFVISMVRRTRYPGTQHDSLPVLIGPQGIGKSTGLRVLVGDQWFSDHMPTPGGKDAGLQLVGKILIEWSEGAALKGNATERTKAFISSPIDRFRPPYGRVAEDFKRTCSFAATSNVADILDDATGARRFWPIDCGKVDRQWLKACRNLLWRQAVAAEEAGEVAWISEATLQTELHEQQASLQKSDPWEEALTDFLLRAGDGITTADLLARVGIPLHERDRREEMRAADILRHNHWERAPRPTAKPGEPRRRPWQRRK